MHIRFLLISLSVLLLYGCTNKPDQHASIQKSGNLRVAIYTESRTKQHNLNQSITLEKILAQLLADRLGTHLLIKQKSTQQSVIDDLLNGTADIGIGVAGQINSKQLATSHAYQAVNAYAVTRLHNTRPHKKMTIKVLANSPYHKLIEQQHPALHWSVATNSNTMALLEQVMDGKADATIINANTLALARRFYPNLRITQIVAKHMPLSFALAVKKKHHPFLHRCLVLLGKIPLLQSWTQRLIDKLTDDTSMLVQLNHFLDQLQQTGQLNNLVKMTHDYLTYFDYVDTRAFVKRIHYRLPCYLDLFQQAAGNDLDWRLLGAMSYQESHWEPLARSPTGVRGMMMLTLATARALGISNRLKAKQSIIGGAQYLRIIKEQLPRSIHEPDRTWFSLAAYNMGTQHLFDARNMTRKQGGNANRWIEVKQRLPLLANANGMQALTFVENIRRYYATLTGTMALSHMIPTDAQAQRWPEMPPDPATQCHKAQSSQGNGDDVHSE